MESNITKENYEYFSKLLIIPLLSFDEVLTRKVDEVLELYFSGSIISIVVFDENIINFIVNKLNERMSSENVYYKNGEIYIDLFNSNNSLNYNGKGHFSIFNFSIYLVKDLVAPSRFIEINNGELLGENILSCNKLFKYLEKIEANSNFNLASYCIQHNVIDEDILISASAGTGKTFSIVSRIMYLLYKSNYDKYFLKDEILLITFTNEATNEMKSRLIKCLENYYKLTKDKKYLECANEVVNSKIATIHSFSIDLIRSNSEVLDLANNFEMVSGIYDIRNIIYIQLEKNIGDYEEYLQKHKIKMKTLKDEILKFYKDILAKNIDLLDLDNNWGAVEKEHTDFVNMLINVLKESYKIYSDKNKEENRFSLGEVNINLKRLLNRDNLKMDNKYKYIFIDEFQDTDDIQIKVINKLKKDNNIKLFVVGDIKQAIYRFRGSDITAFNKIRESISFKRYSLTKNYRTTKSLYQSLDCVFVNMNKRNYLLYKKIEGISKIDNKVYCKNIPKSTYKEDIINKVVEIVKEKIIINHKKETTAILVRTNKQVKEIMEACNKENIYNIKGFDGGDLYNNIEAIELLKLLNALIFYDNIEYLVEFITTNYINFNVVPGMFFNISYQEKHKKIIKILNDKLIQTIGISWDKLHSEIKFKGNSQIILNLIYSLRPWDNSSNHIEYKRNLEKILDIYYKYNEIEYWNIVKFREELKISVYTGKEEQREYIGENSNYIICSTIHNVKGLEYDNVIYPFYPKNSIFKKTLVEYDSTNKKINYILKLDDLEIQNCSFYNNEFEINKDEARLAYVALTRAKKSVYYIDNYKSKWSRIFNGGYVCL